MLRSALPCCAVSQFPMSDPELFGTFHPTNAGGKFWAEQTTVRGFIGETTNRGQTHIDRGRRQVTSFELQPVTQNDGFVEGKPRFGAIPSNEVVDCESIGSLGFGRAKSV